MFSGTDHCQFARSHEQGHPLSRFASMLLGFKISLWHGVLGLKGVKLPDF